MRPSKGFAAFWAVAAVLFASIGSALADQPRPWEMGYQAAATPVMERIESFHTELLVIVTAIASFVLILLLVVIVRFRASANPTPSKTSHNTVIEVLWTVIPVIILIWIAIPSFKLLYYEDRAHDAEMTIKAIGHQWYWSYQYPDQGNLEFDAVMLEDDERQPGDPRLLATDNHVVVPVDTTIRVLVTADDVLHSWSVPSFGVKIDAVPGRLNETWFRVEREGMYYGQCSELCGVRHGFMPIAVEAVSKEAFAAWAEKAKTAFGPSRPSGATKLAAAPAR